MILMGIDIGITGARVIAFPEEGKILAKRYRECRLISPQPGWQELDPRRIMGCIEDCVQEVNTATGGEARAFGAGVRKEKHRGLYDGDDRMYHNSFVR